MTFKKFKKPPDFDLYPNPDIVLNPDIIPNPNIVPNPDIVPIPDKQKFAAYKKFLTSFKSVKTSLDSIVIDPNTIKVINNLVQRVNKLVIHVYHFLKLYCIHQFDNTDSLPIIDKAFIALIFKTIAKRDKHNRGRKFKAEGQNIKDNLKIFFDQIYKPLMFGNQKLSYANLNNLIEYEATAIVTSLSNHIQEHFDEMVNRYINIVCDKDGLMENAKNSEEKAVIAKRLRRIKKDILYQRNKCDSDEDLEIIQNFRDEMLRDFELDTSLMYMAKSNALDLLIVCMRMSISGEKIMKERVDTQKDKKIIKTKVKDNGEKTVIVKNGLFNIINCFPVRKSVIPKYIDIDISVIISSLVTEDKKYYNDNKLKESDALWKEFFDMESKVFKKKGYTFNRMISTDGVGCTILFVRNDLYNATGKTMVKKMNKPKGYTDDIYVNELSDEQKARCMLKKKVGGDPGKDKLVQCSDGEVELVEKENGKVFRKANTYKYTNKLRIETTKSDEYQKIREYERNNKGFFIKDSDSPERIITASEAEQLLSGMNSSSCIWEHAVEYIKTKNQVNHYVQKHYEQYIYRKLKWYSYINRQKADADMVNRFKAKFGGPDECVFLIGDWEQRKQMKYKPPSKGKSVRKLFRNHGYEVYLVDEFRTSCRLYEKGEELINIRGCHSLLGSKILKGRMDEDKPDAFIRDLISEGYIPTIINRDLNGSLNIRLKGMCILMGIPEPSYMDRKRCAEERAAKAAE